jgi:hypothetical protein
VLRIAFDAVCIGLFVFAGIVVAGFLTGGM